MLLASNYWVWIFASRQKISELIPWEFSGSRIHLVQSAKGILAAIWMRGTMLDSSPFKPEDQNRSRSKHRPIRTGVSCHHTHVPHLPKYCSSENKYCTDFSFFPSDLTTNDLKFVYFDLSKVFNAIGVSWFMHASVDVQVSIVQSWKCGQKESAHKIPKKHNNQPIKYILLKKYAMWVW